MDEASFFRLYCEKFNCPPAQFEQRVFWQCLYPQSEALARMIWRVNRDFFLPDLELIRAIQPLTDSAEVKSEISQFRYHHPAPGLLRDKLRVRLSGQRLLNLAHSLFPQSGRELRPGKMRPLARG